VWIITGVDVNILGEEGRTPLHIAAACDHRQLAALLQQHGARTDLITTGTTMKGEIGTMKGEIGTMKGEIGRSRAESAPPLSPPGSASRGDSSFSSDTTTRVTLLLPF
jgi:ankyrin repeat protein